MFKNSFEKRLELAKKTILQFGVDRAGLYVVIFNEGSTEPPLYTFRFTRPENQPAFGDKLKMANGNISDVIAVISSAAIKER